MKKATARSGRSARTVEAARARKTARATKARTRVAARVARSTVAAALGAGVLLHGGHVAPGWDGPAGSVVLVASVDEPGDDGAATADSGADPSGEDSSSESESDAESDSESDSGSDTDSGSDSDAGGAAEDAPEDDGTDDGADDDVTGEDTTATTEGDDPATGAPPVPSSGSSSSASPAPRPAVPAAPTAVTEPARGAAGASTATATRAAVETAVRDATTAATKRAQEALRTAVPATAVPAAPTQQVTGSVLGRLVMALVGLAPTSSSSSSQGLPAPVAPASALLLAQWAFFRRSENPLFNRSPEITSPGGLGPTTGSVVATDPDGDRLTYEVSRQPEHGTVKLDRSTGAYVYTPNPGYTGADSFDVTVRDNDPRARGLGAFTDLVRQALSARHPALAQRLFGAHTDTVTISVAVEAPGPRTNPVSGVTTGDLGVVAGPGEKLTFTVVDAPTRGTLSIDPRGHYVYVPTAAARREAATTPGRDVETVVVRVDRASTAPTMRVFALEVADEAGELVQLELEIPPAAAATPTAGTTIPVADSVDYMTVSPDGKRIYVITYDGALHAVDPATGTSRVVFSDGRTYPPVVSPDGTRAVAIDFGNDRGTEAVLIDTTTDRIVARVPVAGEDINNAYFSPDGTRTYIRDARHGTVTVLDTRTGALITTFSAGIYPGRVEFGDGGRLVYVTSRDDGVMAVLDTTTNRVTTTAVGADAEMLVSADGSSGYVTAYGGQKVTVVEMATGRILAVHDLDAAPYGAVFGPDGSRVYVSTSDGDVHVFDTATGALRGTIEVGEGAYTPRFSPDGTRAVVVGYSDGSVTIIDTADDSVIGVVTVGANPSDVVFGPNGRAYVEDSREIVMIIDTARGTQVEPFFTGTGNTAGGVPSPDGRTVWFTDSDGLTVADTTTDRVRFLFVPNDQGLTFSPDGTRAYAAGSVIEPLLGRQGRFTVIDTATGDTALSLEEPGEYGPAAITPDGRFAVTVHYGLGDGADREVVFVDVVDDSVTRVAVPFAQYVVFSPDGRYAYVGTYDGSVAVIAIEDRVAVAPTDPAEALEAA